MTTEEFSPRDTEYVALRWSRRPGYTLVSYGEVALPVYRLSVRTLAVVETALSTTEVFVLRGIDKGLGSTEEITGVLGLDRRFVTSVLSELVRGDHVGLLAPEGAKRQKLSLTMKGRRTLATEAAEHPEERMIQLFWDGLTRRVVALSDEGLITGQEAKNRGLRTVPTICGAPPSADDLDRGEVERMLDDATGRRKRLVSILSFVAVEKRYVVYQPAVALVYRGRTPSDLLVSFAVDGHVSEQHESAFARAEGVRRLKIARELEEGLEKPPELPAGWESESEGGLPREGAAPSTEVADALLARVEREAAEAAVREATERSERDLALSRVKEAAARSNATEPGLTRPTIRRLSMPEHAPLLRSALSDARSRLLIISPWIRAGVVNHRFVNQLRDLLKGGVKVYIGWGIGDDKEKDMRDVDRRAIEDIERLGRDHTNLAFKYIGNTHAKVLILDRKLAIYGSFNWLSFKGDPNRGFREENSLLVTIPEKVDQLFSQELAQF
ncbi:MAG: phospholipase D-like domain-containing protein [Planctomycetota bacterium]